MRVTIIRETEEFKELEKDWNLLLDQSGQNDIFLTFDWLFTWWQYLKKDCSLFIIAVFDRSYVKAILPLMVTKRYGFRELRFIGSSISDYEGIIIAGDKNSQEELIESVIESLSKMRNWDILRLKGLKNNLAIIDILKKFSFNKKSHLNFILEEHKDGAPEINTQVGWDIYYSSLRKRFLSDIRRQKTKLSDQNVNFISGRATEAPTIEPLLKKFIEMHTIRRKEAGGGSFFEDKNVCNFFKCIADKFFKKGWLDLSYCKVENKIVAMSFNFIYNKCFYHYLSAFDEKYKGYSISRLLLFDILKRCFSDNIEKFDFMLGEEDYKRFWNPEIKKLYFLTVYPKTILGYIAYHYFYKVNIILKRVLGKKW